MLSQIPNSFTFCIFYLVLIRQLFVFVQKPGRSKFEGDYGKRDPTSTTTTVGTTTSTLTTPSTAAWTPATAPPSTAATPNGNIHNISPHTTEESIRTAIYAISPHSFRRNSSQLECIIRVCKKLTLSRGNELFT